MRHTRDEGSMFWPKPECLCLEQRRSRKLRVPEERWLREVVRHLSNYPSASA